MFFSSTPQKSFLALLQAFFPANALPLQAELSGKKARALIHILIRSPTGCVA